MSLTRSSSVIRSIVVVVAGAVDTAGAVVWSLLLLFLLFFCSRIGFGIIGVMRMRMNSMLLIVVFEQIVLQHHGRVEQFQIGQSMRRLTTFIVGHIPSLWSFLVIVVVVVVRQQQATSSTRTPTVVAGCGGGCESTVLLKKPLMAFGMLRR